MQCVFTHRRVREKPPWGGVSTLCEVAPPDPALVEHARRLMEALRWTGVAMVEFKYDPGDGPLLADGDQRTLLGVDPACDRRGRRFPVALRPAGADGRPRRSRSTPTRAAHVWLLGDLDHFLIRLKRGGVRELPRVVGDVLWRTRAGHRLCFDTLARDDPKPFLFELKEWVEALGGGAAMSAGAQLGR